MLTILTTLSENSEVTQVISENKSDGVMIPILIWVSIIIGCFLALRLMNNIEKKNNKRGK